MADNNETTNHLIDDSGVYKDVKTPQITIFVTFCRILTAVMIVLGVIALIVGNM